MLYKTHVTNVDHISIYKFFAIVTCANHCERQHHHHMESYSSQNHTKQSITSTSAALTYHLSREKLWRPWKGRLPVYRRTSDTRRRRKGWRDGDSERSLQGESTLGRFGGYAVHGECKRFTLALQRRQEEEVQRAGTTSNASTPLMGM